MRILRSLVILAVLTFVLPASNSWAAALEEGVALAIVYDTSGSMLEPVRDKNGASTPKYVIANRALIAVARQIEVFAKATSPAAPRKIHTALFIFDGTNSRAEIKLGPFDAGAIQNWAKGFTKPIGGTPLGNAVSAAASAVNNSPLSHKHVLVITDGANTIGPTPAAVMPQLTKDAEAKQATLAFHFVAFDVAAAVFEPAKKLGATVVSAADETQLNTQLGFILEHKILLEAEDPKK